MIKYIGSKRLLIPVILKIVEQIKEAKTIIDLFSGTSRVGYALKNKGYRILSNDYNHYAETIARCYIQADKEDIEQDAIKLIKELNGLKGISGYFTENFCIKSHFFQPHNGQKIDAIREAIASKSLSPELEAVLLTSLLEAADKVDSTTGIQMAYIKEWAQRSYNNLYLQVPQLLPRAKHGKGAAYCMDAMEAAQILEGDIAYLDPPYNQHSYLSNYHIWETLVLWDKPDLYGVACKRIDCQTKKSLFNSRKNILQTMKSLLQSIRAPVLIISFNNEGYVSFDEMNQLLRELFLNKCITIIEKPYPRYVGAKIGIYNNQGQKVGKVDHLTNKEFLYIVADSMINIPTDDLIEFEI